LFYISIYSVSGLQFLTSVADAIYFSTSPLQAIFTWRGCRAVRMCSRL